MATSRCVPVPMSLSLSVLVPVPVPVAVAVCLSDGCFQNVCELDIMYVLVDVALQRVACGIAACCAR